MEEKGISISFLFVFLIILHVVYVFWVSYLRTFYDSISVGWTKGKLKLNPVGKFIHFLNIIHSHLISGIFI